MEVEENILKTVIEKESWEEIIYFIVSKEKLDPWSINIIKLVDGFMKFLREVEELDFRIPAKIIFVAALLLRLKAQYLFLFPEEKEEEEKAEEIKLDTKYAQLRLPIKRFPKRQVTLEELIDALRKALAVQERKEERRRIIHARLQPELELSEDISIAMERVLKRIRELMEKLRRNRIEFKQVVGEWKRDKIVSNFFPLLHLDQERKVDIEQEEFFKEIWITKPKK